MRKLKLKHTSLTRLLLPLDILLALLVMAMAWSAYSSGTIWNQQAAPAARPPAQPSQNAPHRSTTVNGEPVVTIPVSNKPSDYTTPPPEPSPYGYPVVTPPPLPPKDKTKPTSEE